MTTGRLFYPTELKLKILEHLARFEVLTTKDLSPLIYGDATEPSTRTINRTLSTLNHNGFVNQIFFRPESYLGKGNLPNASGLSENGVVLAQEKWPHTYPKEFSKTHSPHTIEHDLRRARAHIAIDKLARDHKLTLGWKKGGNNLVKPDDTFELTLTKTSHFFLEEEHKKKDFDALYEKLKPYVTLHGTGQMKEAWGFRYYTVIIPMRDADAMNNLLVHFSGSCNCIDPKMKVLHKGAPFTLSTDVLAFTSHDDMITRATEPILHTPSGRTLSLLDIVR
jgi:hypothetical protein